MHVSRPPTLQIDFAVVVRIHLGEELSDNFRFVIDQIKSGHDIVHFL